MTVKTAYEYKRKKNLPIPFSRKLKEGPGCAGV